MTAAARRIEHELLPDGTIHEKIGLAYIARPPFIDFHTRKERWAVIVAHRRCGKTVACIVDLIKSALECKHVRPRFAYIAPLYKQAKTVAWDFLKEYGLQIPGAIASESELRLDLPNGGQVRLYGADNPDALRGIYLHGVILDEAADMSPRINEVIRPTLSDYKGWCVWIGTPKGQNDFYDLVHGVKGGFVGAISHPDWFFRMLRASETIAYYKAHPEQWKDGMLDQNELDSARSHLSQAQYDQEYECSFQAAILGAYYGTEMEEAESGKRVRLDIYDPALQVHTAWDLGHSDATAIWFYQQDGFSIRVVDFYAAQGRPLDHYTSMLQDRAARPGSERGYKYGKHYLPHDVKTNVIGMNKTRLASLYAAGLQNIIVVPKVSIDDGINAVRRILPRCHFEREKCADGIKALRQYRREWDDVRKVFYEKPFHDWASDPADAFRYLAVGLQEPTSSAALKAMPKRDNRWIY